MVEKIPPLWTSQIDQILRAHPLTRPLFRGTFPCDELPGAFPLDRRGHFRPWMMVVNTDPSSKPGQHWLLFGADTLDTLYVFDSYGYDLKSYNNKWLNQYARSFSTLKQNTVRYQAMDTNVCGHYCIFVAWQRGDKGFYDFKTLPFLEPLRFRKNDAIIAHWASVDLDLHDVLTDTPCRGQCSHSLVSYK